MKKAIIILTIIAAGVALNFAQTPAEPVPAQPSAPAIPLLEQEIPLAETVVEPSAEAGPATDDGLGADEIAMAEDLGEDAMIEEGRISLRLKDAELKDVVRMFSTLSDANIIVPAMEEEEIKQKIDVNLDNVEWQPALEAILDTHELELYEKIPGTKVYAIRKKAPGAPEATEMKIFKLDYASVGSVSNLLLRMVGPAGSFSVFQERNVVVVQATAKNLQNIGLVMEQVDLPRQQVFIESKFLELTDTAQRDLGINWQVLSGYEVGVNNIGGTYSYTDSKRDEISRNNSFRTLDSQIGGRTSSENRFTDIEGRPYEALTEEPAEGQIEWDARPGNDPENVRVLNLTPTTASGSLSENISEAVAESLASVSSLDASVVARTLGATLSASDFKLILSALEQKDGVEIVSNPKIIVANEEEASIHIGNKEPNIHITTKRGTTDNPGGDVSVELDSDEPYFEDGVKVVVKPTINTSSNITVRITPEITTFIGRKAVNQNGLKLVDYPISQVKKIDTVFSLESGQTAAIGGLTQVSDTTQKNQIPVLGSIPFLGRFFSYEHKVRNQNETIIFVTVSLANPASVDMDTGLPANTRLAQRYQIRENAGHRIDKAERNILQTKENAAMKKELQKLREANRKLIDKQKAKAPVEEIVDVLEAEPVADLPSSLSAVTSVKAEESGGGIYEGDATEAKADVEEM